MRWSEVHQPINAVPVSTDPRQIRSSKVYISWHKATRSSWLNYGEREIADGVAQRFNSGEYTCAGQLIKASTARCMERSPKCAWTIVLSDVPSFTTSEQVKESIRLDDDKPYHIEMGPVSYKASDT